MRFVIDLGDAWYAKASGEVVIGPEICLYWS